MIRKTFLKLLALVLLIQVGPLWGQTPTGSMDQFQQELNKMTTIPNSPEAEAFAQYGDVDASLYSGSPNISVPLYSIKGREMSLPIALTYDHSSVKVEQLATWVGLGWNLQVGGRVSRITNGLPDDFIQGDYTTMNDPNVANKVTSYLNNTSDPKVFSTAQEVENYYDFLNDVNKGLIDTQPDVFSVSAPGLSTHIVFDPADNYTPKSLDNPRLQISVLRGTGAGNPIEKWTITNENGAIYHFGGNSSPYSETELTYRTGNDYTNPFNNNLSGPMINEYTSSWLLTKIQSTYGKDIYVFDYIDFGYWTEEQSVSSATISSTPILPNVTNYNQMPPMFSGGGAGHKIRQQFLSTIKHNGHTVINFDRGVRHDIDVNGVNSRLSAMRIQDYLANPLKTVVFDNDHYFGFNGADASNENPGSIRLKLNGLQIKGKDNSVYQAYSFEYDRADQLPSRSSYAQDYLGYYNGANSNSTLHPRYQNGDFYFAGANRDPDVDKTKIGTLKKIIYPTGGYTTLSYQGHSSVTTQSNQVTLYDFQGSISGNDPTVSNYYLEEDGSLPDDEYGTTADIPKVKIFNFMIDDNPTINYYDLNYYGTAPDVETEAYLVYLGNPWSNPSTVSTNTYKRFSDFTSATDTHWDFQNYTATTLALDPGKYKLLILLDETGSSGSHYGNASFTITHQELASSQINLARAGLRIESMKDYDSNDDYLKGRKYVYEDAFENYVPIMSYIKQVANVPNSQLMRRTSSAKGNEPSTVYRTVKEYQVDQSDTYQGYVIHQFYREDSGLKPRLDAPYETNYYPSIKGGKAKKVRTKDVLDAPVSSVDYEYFETLQRPVSVKGMVVFYNDDQAGNYVYVKNSSGVYTYDLIPGNDCSGGSGSPSEGVTFCPPFPCPTCNGNNYITVMDNIYGGLTYRETFVNGSYGGISVVRDTLYSKDSNNNPIQVVETTSTNYYDAPGGSFLPRETRITRSDGQTIVTTNYYATEEGVTGLINRNNLTEVVRSTTELADQNDNRQLLEAMSKEYSLYSMISDAVLPNLIKSSKEVSVGSSMDERVEFTFHESGNIKESKIPNNGPTTTYLWGYDSMYMVAKIENATYNQVDSTGVNLGVLNSLSSKKSDRDFELNKLRSNLPNALITTYEYDPGVGLISITDSKGQVTYFDYDSFNRLIAIRDQSEKLLKDYTYRTQSQSQ
jgi:YD repeat-containing protein